MSIKIQMFKGKILSDGTHPIVFRINERGDRFTVTLPFSCKPNQWNVKKSCFNSKYDDCEYATKRLRKYYARAIRAVDKFNDEGIDFSERDTFKKLIFEGDIQKNKDQLTILEYLDKHMERLEANSQFDQKDSYRTLRSRLFGSDRCKRFFEDNKTFSSLNVGDLRDYIAHLREDGVKGAVRNYMKDFRALYNDAEQEDIFIIKKNPFKLINFGEFTSEYSPKGMSVASLRKYLNLEVPENLKKSYYTYLLSYYGAGIRFNDLCHLEYEKHIVGGDKDNRYLGGKIVYIALKTGKPMPHVDIDENLAFIIEQLDTGTKYVCPFFNETHVTDKQKYHRRKKCNKQYNTDLKKIQVLAGIKEDLTSHVARHSIASVLIDMGASMREIQSVYNHQRSDTTRHYLASMGYSEVSKIHSKLKIQS